MTLLRLGRRTIGRAGWRQRSLHRRGRDDAAVARPESGLEHASGPLARRCDAASAVPLDTPDAALPWTSAAGNWL
jgi:hypothetical protein